MMATFELTVNNRQAQVEALPDTPLLWVLRDLLDLTGTKFGCGMGLCGACTVHLDGQAVRSCSVSISEIGVRPVVTIEGLDANPGRAVQSAWIEADVPQCGYCQAGQIMTATALLSRTPSPTDQEIDQAMEGNVCRCGTYKRIRQAVRDAAEAAR
jgi:isoquinoline 1-oxidoreductase alpha subunit